MDIRVIDFDGEPWFVTKDVLAALGYPRGSQGYQLHHLGDDEKDTLKIEATVRPMVCISESGLYRLYRLIMRSDKPQARGFQDWVTKIILPAIRKDGMYVFGEEAWADQPSQPPSPTSR